MRQIGPYTLERNSGRTLTDTRTGQEVFFQLGDDTHAVEEEWNSLEAAMERENGRLPDLPDAVLGAYF